MHAIEILIPISFFITSFGIVYVIFSTRNRERLAMIEKGLSPEIFAEKRKRFGIRIGLLSMGIAIGILMGQLIAHTTKMDIEPATFSMIFLFGGLGLVVDHLMAKKENI